MILGRTPQAGEEGVTVEPVTGHRAGQTREGRRQASLPSSLGRGLGRQHGEGYYKVVAGTTGVPVFGGT